MICEVDFRQLSSHRQPGNGIFAMALERGGSEGKIERSAGQAPQHIAIIMDGNGRWAKAKGLPRVEGHRAGAKTVRMVVEESRRLGVRYLTLYAFSTENWKRPATEVSALMSLLSRYLDSELKLMLDSDIRLRTIGDTSMLPSALREVLQKNIDKTRNGKGMDLILALSYGGREEITNAMRSLAAQVKSGILQPEQIDQQHVAARLYAPDIPDPDLLIRTSQEFRVSNFLLWQIAYAEIVISQMLWPDFDKAEFHRCIAEYSTRERRFGLTGEQLADVE